MVFLFSHLTTMSCPGSEKFPTAPLIIISGQDVDRGRGHDARGEVGGVCRW